MKKLFFFLGLNTLAALLFAGMPIETRAAEATLFLTPSSGTIKMGGSLSVTIMVNTQGENVNAVAAYFAYPQDKFDVTVSTADSALTFITESRAINGRVEISGGLPTPGFSGTKKIATLTLKAKASSGSAELTVAPDSAVLTDVGNSNILNYTASGKGTYSFAPAAIILSPTPALSPSPTATQSPTPRPSVQPTSQPQVLTIQDVQVKNIGSNKAVVAWKTTKPADSVVHYGPSLAYAFMIVKDPSVSDHEVVLENLFPETQYYFFVQSKADGKIVQTEQKTFITGKTGGTDNNTQGNSKEVVIKVMGGSFLNTKPIAGAVVEIKALGKQETTNEEGSVTFSDVPAGEQEILVKNGVEEKTERVSVGSDSGPQTIEINLSSIPVQPLVIGLVGLVLAAAVGIFVLIQARSRSKLAAS
ncbi:MAG: hypothetical protein HYV77_00250 [Candidatus Wildermuthbacteria bacterium]|nr:hypothetical protein [Candidatus Wildermuthbacteria bacterium]